MLCHSDSISNCCLAEVSGQRMTVYLVWEKKGCSTAEPSEVRGEKEAECGQETTSGVIPRGLVQLQSQF